MTVKQTRQAGTEIEITEKDDPEFMRVVDHFLKTPPKPHKAKDEGATKDNPKRRPNKSSG